ncbi:MAG: hypothetical protein PHC61_01105 [Chitinivibrionales bacterium]|nr:hypothetical protein [Chitinivibrionales bacterium]
MRLILSIALVALLNSLAWSTDTTKTTQVLIDIQKTIRDEYCACTGDVRQADFRVIMAWKKKQSFIMQSPQYTDALARYKKEFPAKLPVRPCDVIAWLDKEKERQTVAEKIIIRALLVKQDSIDLMAELAQNPVSPYDFGRLPFGLMQETFIELFALYYPGVPLLNTGRYLHAENVGWGPLSLTAAFYFNKAGRLYKYALESKGLPVDSLEFAVRPAAAVFDSVFTQRIGAPSRVGMVALFDIKDNLLSLRDEWEGGASTVFTGISRHNYTYYAKAVITNVALDDRKQKQGDKIIVTEAGKETHYLSDGPAIP